MTEAVAVTAPVLVVVTVVVLELVMRWLATVKRPRSWDERLSPFHLALVPLVACAGRGATASRKGDCSRDQGQD